MKNKEQFDWTVGVLVKAYLEGTLEHTNCAACAIGNLVAAKRNYQINGLIWTNSDGDKIEPSWGYLQFLGNLRNDIPFEHKKRHPKDKALSELAATGYRVWDTCKIEKSFEMVYGTEDDQYHGLLAVVDALIEIHQGNEEERDEAKQIFQDAKESKAV